MKPLSNNSSNKYILIELKLIADDMNHVQHADGRGRCQE